MVITGAGVVLHAKEVVPLDGGQVVGEFLLPDLGGFFLAAGQRLDVVQAQRQADLNAGTDLPDNGAGSLVGFHDQLIAVGRAGIGEALGRLGAEHGLVFGGDSCLIGHHLLEVHAHLHRPIGGLPARLGLGGHLHHLFFIPLGNGRDLHAHVCLVDCADISQLTAKVLHHIPHIAGEVGRGCLGLPAALGDQPHRAGKVVQRHDGFQAVCLAAVDHIPVMFQFRRVKAALLRLDAGPLDGKAVGVEPGPGHQADVLGILVIMVAGVQRGLDIAGVFHLFLRPAVIVDVVALHLVGGGGGADQKSGGKLCHGKLLSNQTIKLHRTRRFAVRCVYSIPHQSPRKKVIIQDKV